MVLVLPCERSGLQALRQTLEGMPLRFYQVPSPCDCHLPTPHVTRFLGLSPSIFAYYKQSKLDWRWEQPGNEATRNIWCIKHSVVLVYQY